MVREKQRRESAACHDDAEAVEPDTHDLHFEAGVNVVEGAGGFEFQGQRDADTELICEVDCYAERLWMMAH